jgi:hypothetical protein
MVRNFLFIAFPSVLGSGSHSGRRLADDVRTANGGMIDDSFDSIFFQLKWKSIIESSFSLYEHRKLVRSNL